MESGRAGREDSEEEVEEREGTESESGGKLPAQHHESQVKVCV